MILQLRELTFLQTVLERTADMKQPGNLHPVRLLQYMEYPKWNYLSISYVAAGDVYLYYICNRQPDSREKLQRDMAQGTQEK